MAAEAATTQQEAEHERRQQPSSWTYGLLARRLCNFMADDGVLGRQIMAGVLWEVQHGVSLCEGIFSHKPKIGNRRPPHPLIREIGIV